MPWPIMPRPRNPILREVVATVVADICVFILSPLLDMKWRFWKFEVLGKVFLHARMSSFSEERAGRYSGIRTDKGTRTRVRKVKEESRRSRWRRRIKVLCGKRS